MLKILQARLQQDMNWEIPDVEVGFIKGRGARDQIANIHWIIEKAGEFKKNISFIDYAKAFDCVDHNKLWEILKEMEIPDHLICFLRNLYACQEATVRTGHGATHWFTIRKRVCQGCTLLLCLYNFWAQYITWDTRLDESQAGIKIAGRNINNLKYANVITLMVKSEEEIQSLLMRVKKRVKKTGLKLNIQKTKIMTSSPITLWQIEGEKVETETNFLFLGSKSLQTMTAATEVKDVWSLEEKLWQT